MFRADYQFCPYTLDLDNMELVAGFDMLGIEGFVDKLVASGTTDRSRLSRTHVFSLSP